MAVRGHTVAVLTFDRPGEPPFYDLDASVELRPLDIGVPGQSTPRWALFQLLPRLRRQVSAWKPDVVVGFMHSMYLPLGAAMSGLSVPLIASEHDEFAQYESRKLEALLFRLIPWISRIATTTSRQIREGFPVRVANHMVVMANPVVGPAKASTEVGQTLRAGRSTILSVGSLTDKKDHDCLIRAFALLVENHPEWKLRIVGEGVLRPTLEATIRELQLSESVSLPGSTPDVEAEYQNANIFAMPSRSESFGLVTAEALAYGLPVVGFADCPGTNELVQHGTNGLLVEGHDRSRALAHGLDLLMVDEPFRRELGRNGPPSVEAYGLPAALDRWEQLLRSLSTHPAPRKLRKCGRRQ